MYQVHQIEWLRAGFLLCLGLAAGLAAWAQFRKLKPPNYAFVVLLGLAVIQFMAMGRLRVSDNDRLREELKNLDISSVSNLTLRIDGNSPGILGSNEINILFSQLQQVQAVPAHHSSPVDPVDLQFMLDGHEYRYRIARDSERPDEYWVLETGRAGEPGREIGRIQSTQLKSVLKGH